MFFNTKFKATITTVLLFLGLGVFCGVRAVGAPQSSSAPANAAQENWRKEFDDVCGKTQDAMSFTPEQLTDLIRRCDALRPQIEKTEKLDETGKKVYLGRLRMCRGLYAYVLDEKKKDKK
ncbi:MAG: hypothetical protein WCB94_15775 [Terriglobales bacterium]